MAVTFVNVGAANGVNGTSLSPALPGSRVNGNLLLSWLRSNSAQTLSGIGIASGWKILGATRDQKFIVAWRLVDGSETSPNWTFGNSVTYAQVIQLSGNSTTTPIGNYSFLYNGDPGQVTTTLNAQSITSTVANSMFFAFLSENAINQTPATPTNYTSTEATPYSDSNGSVRTVYETAGSLGGASDAISDSITSTNWETCLVEVLAAAATCPQFTPGSGTYGLGWFANSVTSTNITVTLPSPRVNGDIIIAAVASQNAGIAFTWPGGWTPVDSISANISASYAYAYVTGSETAPNVTWSGSHSVLSRAACFTRVAGSSPIGAKSNANGASGTVSISGITTTKPNSAIVSLAFPANVPTSIPAHYTTTWWESAGSIGSELAQETVLTSGNVSDAVSFSGTSGIWGVFLFELLSASTLAFRKTLSSFGGRIGSRQIQGYMNG